MSNFRTKLLAGICLAGLSFSAVAAGTTSIGAVDMQSVFKSSTQIKKINAQLKTKFAARQKVLMKKRSSLQAEQKKLTKNKPIMSTSRYEKAKAKLDKALSAYTQSQVVYQKDVYNAQSAAMNQFTQDMKAVIAKVAKQHHITVVIDSSNALFVAKGSDLTSDVVKATG